MNNKRSNPTTTRFRTKTGLNSQSGFGLIEFGILLIILVVIVLLAIPLYRDFTIAQKVAVGAGAAAEVKTLVAKNAAAGLNFDAGWTPPQAAADLAGIGINRDNGEISLNFGPDAGNGSLIFAPLLNGQPLSGGTDTSSPATGDAALTWNCNSAAAPETQLGTHGTLAGKYALLGCKP